ncbi:MAG: GerMN domain-containing protein [Acetobacteraceae bacterium]|nr:GerMN domain-containing protein [Acetobacteraceae bacterium]
MRRTSTSSSSEASWASRPVRRPRAPALLLALGMIVTVLAPGCRRAQPQPPTPPAPPPAAKVKVVVYFGDQQAMYLEPEVREVPRDGRSDAEVAMAELLKGPAQAGHVRTIPEGVRLLGVTIEGDLARVDFSRELTARHGGGSAGELFTVYSIVNTLTELPGVKRVQILQEGKPLETLAGHMELLEPISRSEELIRR